MEDKIFLQHIFDSVCLIEEFVKDADEEQFLHDLKTQAAVIRQFEIIGEATKNLSEQIKLKSPEIPWREIQDTRNRLIHAYFEVSLKILWDTIKNDLSPFKKQVENLLKIPEENKL